MLEIHHIEVNHTARYDHIHGLFNHMLMLLRLVRLR